MRVLKTLLSLALVARIGAQQPSAYHQLGRAVLREMIETNTTASSGNTTTIAEQLEVRFKDAGFPAADVQVVGPTPKNRNLIVRYRGSGAKKPVLLLAHLDVVEAKPTDWTYDPFKLTEKEGLASNDVGWIFEDRDAHIWLGTGNGASRYDGKSMTNFTTKEGLVHNSVYAIAQDASGRIWFGTQGGISSYDGKSFSNLADQVGRPFVNVRTIVVDRSGNLWFGGQEGAFRYDGKTLATFTSKEGLLDDFVGSMIVDQAGNIWLGHPGGFPGGTGGGPVPLFRHCEPLFQVRMSGACRAPT